MPTTHFLPAVEFVSRLRARGMRLAVEGSNVRVSPRSLLTDDDRATIRERKPELLKVLTAPNDAPDWRTRWNRPSAPWGGDDAELIDWFHSCHDSLPREPFPLFPWASVCDPVTFYASLESSIQAGSNGPRAAGLQHHLKRLRELF